MRIRETIVLASRLHRRPLLRRHLLRRLLHPLV